MNVKRLSTRVLENSCERDHLIHQEKSPTVEQFKALAQEYWTKVYEGNSKAANLKSRAAHKLVSQWNQAGQISEILPPMLFDDSAVVRCAAATFLLNFGESQEAVSVLRELALNDTTLVATTAKTVLRMHKFPLDVPSGDSNMAPSIDL